MDRFSIGMNSDKSPQMLTIDSTLRRELDEVKDRVTKGSWDYFGLAAGIPGCLSGDTIIKGQSKSLQELYDSGIRNIDTISIKEFIGKKGEVQRHPRASQSEIFYSGEKDVYEIELENGKKVLATEEHKFFNHRYKEVMVSDLKIGDNLKCYPEDYREKYLEKDINKMGKKYYSKIKSIKKIGKMKTYDLHTPIYHNFLLDNGILSHNSGKSTLMRTTIAPYLAETLNNIYIVFTADDFVKTSNECPENSVILVDEGFADWNSRQSTRNTFLKLVNHAQLIRQKHLYILICLPNFFDLSKTIAIFRSSHLFVTYATDRGRRGQFLAFGRDKKRELYIKGSKYMDYNCVRANFVGNFRMNKGLMDDEGYERLKKRHLLSQEKELSKPDTDRVDRANLITDNVIINLKRKSFTQKEMAEILNVNSETVSRHWIKLKRDRKIPPDLLI